MEPIDPPQPKSRSWVWILILAVLACLCCLLLAAAVGIGYNLWQQGRLSIPGLGLGTTATPTRAAPLPLPSSTPRPEVPSQITVEPYDPAQGAYPTLYELTPGWEGQSSPGVNMWAIQFASDQAVSLYSGWCTATPAVLEQNFEHITYFVEVDGMSIPLDQLFWFDREQADQVCRIFSGIIWAWPVGEHVIVVVMRLDAAVNDGWGDYPAGDYVDRFVITVTP